MSKMSMYALEVQENKETEKMETLDSEYRESLTKKEEEVADSVFDSDGDDMDDDSDESSNYSPDSLPKGYEDIDL